MNVLREYIDLYLKSYGFIIICLDDSVRARSEISVMIADKTYDLEIKAQWFCLWQKFNSSSVCLLVSTGSILDIIAVYIWIRGIGHIGHSFMFLYAWYFVKCFAYLNVTEKNLFCYFVTEVEINFLFTW